MEEILGIKKFTESGLFSSAGYIFDIGFVINFHQPLDVHHHNYDPCSLAVIIHHPVEKYALNIPISVVAFII